MQGLEGDDELRGRAVRVGDDALLLDVAHRLGVHLRDHEGHVGVVAPGRGVVDHDRALRGDAGDHSLETLAAGGHQAEVHVGKIVGVEGLGLQRLVPEGDLDALAAAGGEGHHRRRPGRPLGEDVQHLAAHIARRTDDGHLVPWIFSLSALSRRIQDP